MEISLTIKYVGASSDNGMIDFYDASQALAGFERVISLTTHLVLNDEVIVQSPSLRGAQILASPAALGSWKTSISIVLASSVFTAGMAPRDSAIGHLMVSAYDYVISEALGFNVDFNSTLGQQHKEMMKLKNVSKPINQSRFDSVIEKCESGLKAMHRPIVNSNTAEKARIYWESGSNGGGLNSTFSKESFEYISTNFRSSDLETFCGIISSYNANTFKGRMYVPQLDRNLPFELSNNLQSSIVSANVADNLATNIRSRGDGTTLICFDGHRNESRGGALKGLFLQSLVIKDEV